MRWRGGTSKGKSPERAAQDQTKAVTGRRKAVGGCLCRWQILGGLTTAVLGEQGSVLTTTE
jgi:hypothetical protein